MFGSWADVISKPPKTRSRNTSSATSKGHRKSRIQPSSKSVFYQMRRITSGFVLAKIIGVISLDIYCLAAGRRRLFGFPGQIY